MSDHSRGKYRRRRQSPLVTALTIGVVVAAIIFLGCLYLAVSNQMRLRRMARDVAQLAATQTVALPTSQNNANTAPNQPAVSVETQAAETPTPTQPREILPQFQDLAAQNPDLAGWLTVGGTRIDYPVMYSPDEPERYLHANFEKQYSFAGLPFIDAAGQVDSGNRVIYAHNMLDGSMFRGLFRYEQKNYWEKHPTFTFSTLYEEKEYEIMSVFYDKVYRKTDTNFKFYQFFDTSDADHFARAMEHFQEKQLYDTGVTAQPGDKLITLVTCAYQTDNGRFVVVAREKT